MKRMEDLLQKLIIIDIHGKDNKMMKGYANLYSYSKNNHPTLKLGKSVGIGQNDVWIAATAFVTESTLVTMDNDFDHFDPEFIKVIKFKQGNE